MRCNSHLPRRKAGVETPRSAADGLYASRAVAAARVPEAIKQLLRSVHQPSRASLWLRNPENWAAAGSEGAVLVERVLELEIWRGAEMELKQLNDVVDHDNVLAYDEYRFDRLHSFFEVRFEIPI